MEIVLCDYISRTIYNYIFYYVYVKPLLYKYLETMLFFYAGNLQKNFVIDIYWQIISTRTVVLLLRNLEKKMKYHSFKYG